MAKDTTSEKKSEKKQPGKIRKWFKDLKVEFKKVVWPTKQTVVTNTSVGALDEGFLALFRAIYR